MLCFHQNRRTEVHLEHAIKSAFRIDLLSCEGCNQSRALKRHQALPPAVDIVEQIELPPGRVNATSN